MDDATKCPKCGSRDTNCQSGTSFNGDMFFEAWCNTCGFSTYGED